MDLQLPIDIRDEAGNLVGRFEKGSAEGSEYVTLRLFNGDLINVRNVQGGTADNPNLDIGAGSSALRGNIILNWDVGKGVHVYDGHKNRMLSINRDNNHLIESWAPMKIHKGAKVYHPETKSWKTL